MLYGHHKLISAAIQCGISSFLIMHIDKVYGDAT